MDNKKTDQYYIDKIITDLTFIRTHTESLSKSKLEEDEILVDSIMFRLIQVAENSEKLTEKFKKTYPSIPWRAIKGLRNRIVHEYGNVDLTIVCLPAVPWHPSGRPAHHSCDSPVRWNPSDHSRCSIRPAWAWTGLTDRRWAFLWTYPDAGLWPEPLCTLPPVLS